MSELESQSVESTEENNVQPPKFVHLRVHSDFSMCDGLNKVKPIVAKAAELNMPAIALTDQTNMCGLVKFYHASHGAGLKPIIGSDFWVKSDELENELSRLVVIATNNKGYKNLTELMSKAYLRGHIQGKAVIDKDWLVEYAEGLILLSGGREGDIGLALLKGNRDLVDSMVSFYQQYFPNNFFLELIRTGRENEENYLHLAVELAENKQLPVVATNEVVFLSPDLFDAHEIRVAIHDGYTLDDKRRPKKYSAEQYLRSEAEMIEQFQDIPEAIENTVEIAQKCNVFSENQKLLASFDYESKGLLGKGVGHIAEDEFGTIWLGVTKSGLFEFVEDKKELNKSFFIKHNFVFNGNDYFDSHDIATVLPDSKCFTSGVCPNRVSVVFYCALAIGSPSASSNFWMPVDCRTAAFMRCCAFNGKAGS